ncbi:hypothetical protein C8R45DRAFT_1214994, partial [Mycena sanguinolenta]
MATNPIVMSSIKTLLPQQRAKTYRESLPFVLPLRSHRLLRCAPSSTLSIYPPPQSPLAQPPAHYTSDSMDQFTDIFATVAFAPEDPIDLPVDEDTKVGFGGNQPIIASTLPQPPDLLASPSPILLRVPSHRGTICDFRGAHGCARTTLTRRSFSPDNPALPSSYLPIDALTQSTHHTHHIHSPFVSSLLFSLSINSHLALLRISPFGFVAPPLPLRIMFIIIHCCIVLVAFLLVFLYYAVSVSEYNTEFDS